MFNIGLISLATLSAALTGDQWWMTNLTIFNYFVFLLFLFFLSLFYRIKCRSCKLIHVLLVQCLCYSLIKKINQDSIGICQRMIIVTFQFLQDELLYTVCTVQCLSGLLVKDYHFKYTKLKRLKKPDCKAAEEVYSNNTTPAHVIIIIITIILVQHHSYQNYKV